MSKSHQNMQSTTMAFEDSPLYRLIKQGSPQALAAAMSQVDQMTDEEVRLRSNKDRSTYYHHMVKCAASKSHTNLTLLFPIIYKLALRNMNVNAQNVHGNTCLHLACLKPHTEALCKHFIRVGADPCIMNKSGCRVIHTCRGHVCYLAKGQAGAKSGIWNAVEKEDQQLTEKLVRSFCRINIWKNKSLCHVADETGNTHIIKLLEEFKTTNELAINAFAGDIGKVREIIRAGADLDQKDESCEPPMPLVIAIREMGEVTREVEQVLRENGQDPGVYQEILQKRMNEFENTKFYRKVEEGTEESMTEALELVAKLDVTLTSFRSERTGWTYLHYVVDSINKFRAEGKAELARILIRMIYKLALRGIDVNRRDAQGTTALIKASERLDQALMTHVLRIGGDPQLSTSDGRTVNEEVYEDKGKLVFDRKYRQADLPGLWVAIANNDISKAERWLKSWSRVEARWGDRRMIELARDLNRPEIVKLLEANQHINEFVCAIMACDLKAGMHLLALGKGIYKVNTIDDFFHVGYTWDRHAEFMPRPIIIAAMEICTPAVVDFLLDYGADLSKQYEESYPCGPIAFWAFRDHIDNRNTLVVARHADVGLQDELGCTMLHKAVQKKQTRGMVEIIQILLDRGINIAARDYQGSTARDYVTIYGLEDATAIQQIIDGHVLEIVSNDQHYELENLIIESYDHIADIRGKKNKGVKEIADLKEYKEIIWLMEEYDKYKEQIQLLHDSARTGDLRTISKLSGEKRCAWSKDMAGRTLLHNAVLYENADVVKFLIDQHPHLINSTDNLLRTPLHYCVCLEERQEVWTRLQDGGANQHLMDVNNLTVYDYVRELDVPTPTKDRPRGRRDRNYRPDTLIQMERMIDYGGRVKRYELHGELMKVIPGGGLSDVKALTADVKGSLAGDDLDITLLKLCVDEKREAIAKHLIEKCGARHDAVLKIVKEDKEEEVPLGEYCEHAGLNDLVAFIKSRENQGSVEQAQVELEQCSELEQCTVTMVTDERQASR